MNNNQPLNIISIENKNIEECIYNIRGQQVMLDSDVAFFFGTEVKKLNQQMKRNIDRFPDDFYFQLTEKEYETALESIDIKSTDYYVQKLIYNKAENRIYRRVLKMNKNTGLFIDSNGISYYGNPYTMTDIETGEEKKLVGIITEDQYNQIQANKRKIKEI